uniref:Major facilitator superfamily (MFS) profile domain-containing protein n=1 Tax=Alexandrium monilatum TaxID=311494 RepID=A0A7S4SF44_9DINO
MCSPPRMCLTPKSLRPLGLPVRLQHLVAISALAAAVAAAPHRKDSVVIAPEAPDVALAPASGGCSPSITRDSPWLALHQCAGAQHHALLRVAAVESVQGGGDFWGTVRWDRILGIAIFMAGIIFAIFSIKDLHCFISALVKYDPEKVTGAGRAKPRKGTDGDAEEDVEDEREPWSITGLILLTIYRFYTGFLSATWLPYLLAMEGEYLWSDKQAVFMALAKLLYGVSILFNPLFGLVGDELVAVSHGVGRRIFIRVGLTLAAVGLYICVLAGRDRAFLGFLSGIFVWRIGEGLNDVTTEAIVPELVPPSQFQIASAIKASSSILGGLFGYVLLIVFENVHYSWLYYAYPIGMFFTSLPPLYLLNSERPFVHARKEVEKTSCMDSMAQAYLSPMQFPGGFPAACLAVFLFSLGTAPMFFLLLIVRDIVGITEHDAQQQQFSLGAIVFFLSAALTSCLSGLVRAPRRDGGGAGEDGGAGDGRGTGKVGAGDRGGGAVSPSRQASNMEIKGRMLVVSMLVFGLVVITIPTIALLSDRQARTVMFYVFTVVFGGSFGTCFTIFQELTWQLLPPGVRVANAMGFNVMSRLFGVGLGNFLSGMILDLAYSGETDGYLVWGYWVMHSFSGVVVLVSIPVTFSVIGMARRVELESLTSPAVPAA